MISSPAVNVVGSAQTTGNATIANLHTGAIPVADPLAGLAAPTATGPATVPSIQLSGQSKQSLSPGVYGSIQIAGQAQGTLSPGTFVVLNQLAVTGQASLIANGVTVYLACPGYPAPCAKGQAGGSLVLAGKGALELTPPANSCPATSIFSDPNNTSTLQITGTSTQSLTGIIYAKSGTLNVTGTPGGYNAAGQIVDSKTQVAGTGTVTVGANPPMADRPSVELSPPTGGPNLVGTTQTLQVNLNCGTRPLAGQHVTFSVTGANPSTQTVTTNGTGYATLTYKGDNAGTDNVQATYTGEGFTTTSTTSTITWVHPAPTPYDGAQLSLAPTTAGPYVPHTPQTLTATLTDRNGNPLARQLVHLAISGANPTNQTAGTDLSGKATFTYSGQTSGVDTAVATYGTSTYAATSNPATITWQAPTSAVVSVSVSPVEGNFYSEPPTAAAFTAKPGDSPAFSQTFPDIEFNPPNGVIPHDTSGVTTTTRPFTDIVTDLTGSYSSYSAAQGNGHQAGIGDMAAFDAEFQGTFNISKAGPQVFTLYRNDGYILGVGNSAAGVSSNPSTGAPPSGTTPFRSYPIMAADNQANGTSLGPDSISITFPAAGTYPFELDYLQRPAAGIPASADPMTLALEVGNGVAGALALSLGYAYGDGTGPNFPSPWQASPDANFVGGPAPSQSGPPVDIKWTTGAAIPNSHEEEAVAAAGGRIYAISGGPNCSSGGGGPLTAAVDVYDPGSNTFASAAPIPHARAETPVAGTIGGLLYVVGGTSGCSGSTVSPIDVYSPADNTWNTLPSSSDFPSSLGSGAYGCGAVVGSELFYFSSGGIGVLDTSTAPPTWSVRPQNGLLNSSEFCQATPEGPNDPTSSDAKVVLTGPGDASCDSNSQRVIVYSPSSNELTLEPEVTNPIAEHSAWLVEGFVVVAGNDCPPQTNVQLVSTTSHQVIDGSPLPDSRFDAGSATVNNVLYVLGGGSPSTATPDVLIGTLSGGTWDSGALRFENPTGSPVTLDHVTVDIGSAHFDPGLTNVVVPPHGSAILTGSAQNSFDTSDAAEVGAGTSPGGSGASGAPPVANSVTLAPIATGFPSPIGIDYYQPTNEIVMSVNYSGGEPNNFDLVDSSGNFSPFSKVSGLTDEVYVSAIRTSGCEGGFTPGDMYFGTGVPGVIARLTNNGTTLTNPWVTLPGEQGLLRGGLFQDIYCVTGGDLIVTTTAGDVWRVTSSGQATEVAAGVGDTLEGPTTVPKAASYGPWSGQILVSSEGCGCVQSIDPTSGAHATWSLGQGNMQGAGVGSAEAVYVVPPNENFFGVDYGAGTLRGAPASQFTGLVGDVLVATEFPGRLVAATWDPVHAVFDTTDLLSTNANQWEGTTFAAAGLPGVPPTPICVPATATPQIHVTINGLTTTFADTGKVLTDGGTDPDHCGGADESQPWTSVGGAATPLPPSTLLNLSPRLVPDQAVGNTVSFQVQAVDQTGQPEHTNVTLTDSGANAQTITLPTDSNGTVSFPIGGKAPGLDTLTATASGPAAVSNSVQIRWYAPQPATPPPGSSTSGTGAPAVTILTPNSGETVTVPTAVDAAITVPSGGSVASWSAAFKPHGSSSSTSIATGTGTPPPTLGTFDPTSLAAGQYDISVTATTPSGATGTTTVTIAVANSTPPVPPTVGAISPSGGTVVTSPTPITATCSPAGGQTVTGWSVTVTSDAGGTPSTIQTGTGNTASATFDPTLLTNGSYTITVNCTDSDGGTQSGSTDMAVSGNLKLGRYVTTYQDMAVPVAGLQMQVLRTYDSTDKTPGDFGIGWRVSLTNFRVSTNRALGAGGWSQYNPACVGALCLTAYKTSAPHYVTVTWPDGHQEMFDFTPQGGSVLFPTITPAFTDRPNTNTTSTLTADGSISGLTADGSLVDGNGNIYNPTRYTLTTHDGQVYVLDINTGLISETDPNGNRISVDATGIHSTLGPASAPTPGPSLTFFRDSQGRITDVTGPDSGEHVHYSYTYSSDELSAFTDPNGNESTYCYGPQPTPCSGPQTGDLTLTNNPNGAPVQTLQYENGRLYSIALGNQAPTIISTDLRANTQTVLDPNGKLTTILTYDNLGDIVQQDEIVPGQPALTTKYTYDPVGLPQTVTDPPHHTTTWAYDESTGDLLSVTDASNPPRTWSFENYNAFGEPTVIRQPDGTVNASITYDPNTGQITSTQDATGQPTTFSYWPSGQPQTITYPGNRTTSFTYDANGNLASLSDGGSTESIMIDSGGRVRQIQDTSGDTTKFDYWPGGQLKTMTDPNLQPTQYTYDTLNRLYTVQDPLGNTTTYLYNDLSLVKQRTDRNNAITKYVYDVDGNLTQEITPSGTTDYAYNPLGQLTGADNSSGHIDQTYYPSGMDATQTTCASTGSSTTPCAQSTSTTQPVVTLTRNYWPNNQPQSVSSTDAGAIQYSYDANGQLQDIQDPSNNIFLFTYNASGQLATESRPNSVDSTFGYTTTGDLQNIDSSLNGTTVANYDYTFDPATGQRRTQTDPTGTSTYTYWPNGQLQSATHPANSGISNETYTYDSAGNRINGTGIVGTAIYNAADQLQNDGKYNYTYDKEGNLRTKTPVGGGPGTTYDWNTDNQLVAIHDPNGTTTTYQYDPLGRRISVNNNGQESRYVYDGIGPHSDYSSQNQLTTAYTTSPGQIQPVEWQSGGDSTYNLTDGQGSARTLTDSSGAITGSLNYSAYGVPAATNSPTTHTYTGYQYDQTSGLYDANARYYDPTTGRFLSTDPQPATNPYPYAANDPTNLTDPTGNQAITDFAINVKNYVADAWKTRSVAKCLAGALGGISGALTGFASVPGHPEQVTGYLAGSAIAPAIGCAIGEVLGDNVWVQWLGGAIAGGISGAITTALQCKTLDAGTLWKGFETGFIAGLISGVIPGAIGLYALKAKVILGSIENAFLGINFGALGGATGAGLGLLGPLKTC
jgi:RHS repeat-associated protein